MNRVNGADHDTVHDHLCTVVSAHHLGSGDALLPYPAAQLGRRPYPRSGLLGNRDGASNLITVAIGRENQVGLRDVVDTDRSVRVTLDERVQVDDFAVDRRQPEVGPAEPLDGDRAALRVRRGWLCGHRQGEERRERQHRRESEGGQTAGSAEPHGWSSCVSSPRSDDRALPPVQWRACALVPECTSGAWVSVSWGMRRAPARLSYPEGLRGDLIAN